MSRAVTVCPHCAQPAEEPLVCDRCGWRWYANPKPAAAVLLERPSVAGEPSVLLLLRAMDPGRGAWDLPAGYLDPGESFEHAARREAREEAGLEVELLALAGVYHSPGANAVTVVYRARPLDAAAEVEVDAESTSHAWVGRSEVPNWLPRMA
ncbi:MAG: NUDIX domain-containing protein, partial [Actinobacteria bacterium]|nr:NUDIX domain-containing protein [Actinomycetota bacterium]